MLHLQQRWYRNIRRRIGLSKAKMHRVKANTGGRRNIPSRQELDRMTHAVDVRIDQGVYSNYCGLCSDKVALFGLDETGQTNDKHYCVLSSILPIPGIPIDEYSEPMTHQGTPGDHNENPSYRGYRDAEIKPDGIDDSAYIPMHITPLGNPIPHYLTPCFSENIRSLCKLPIPYPKYT